MLPSRESGRNSIVFGKSEANGQEWELTVKEAFAFRNSNGDSRAHSLNDRIDDRRHSDCEGRFELRTIGPIFLICGIAIAAVALNATPQTYAIDPARSRATIAVGKAGIFSFAAGHTHEVIAPSITGHMTVDPADPSRSMVRVTIDASALKVTGKGEPPDDVPRVQQTMASEQVLDVRRYPTIDFDSTSISVKNPGTTKLDLIINGRLTLHTVTRSVSVPVMVQIEPHELTSTGSFSLKQTDYGIKPVSVGGVVSVKDTVNINFIIVGRLGG